MSVPDPSQSDWRRLFRIACHLIEQVNEESRVIDYWTLGGGTAMMLQINHRESHDIDIFFHDPQILPFLNPSTHEFVFEIMPTEYEGDGSGFLKFVFKNIGEIDFIVASALTDAPTVQQNVERATILVETAPEVIAKKIYHRGASIKPRDIFDIAAAGRIYRDDIIRALTQYPDQVKATLTTIERLNPEFVRKAISQLMIRDDFRDVVESALEDTRGLLQSVCR